ncbi:hypothetical protein K2Y11_18830, partial [bacterium]|nr:hypothetical protein [bacterium]
EWTPDGRSILVAVGWHGAVQIARVELVKVPEFGSAMMITIAGIAFFLKKLRRRFSNSFALHAIPKRDYLYDY